MDCVKARHEVLKTTRAFFYRRNFLEVETPYLTRFPAPDAHIEPLRAFVADEGPFFLHTSPEIGMKRLLAKGYEKIFQICKVFRVEELEEVHRTEFTMLEWYMPGDYTDAMAFTEGLVKRLARELETNDQACLKARWKRHDLAGLFLEKAGINPFILSKESLIDSMRARGIAGLQQIEPWDDLFFKLFIQEVEPRIEQKAPYFVKNWPVNISSMAKRRDEHSVERFELYIRGLEIANGYTELLDAEEQHARFLRENENRRNLGKEQLPVDMEFLSDLARVRGPVAGVSVGVDRLLMVLLGKRNIADVLQVTNA